jgi:RNA polymerase sigma factor (sigma-70 family)
MTIPGSSAARRHLPEHDPVRPEDRATDADLRAQVQTLYRQQSERLVRQLARRTGCTELAREIAHDAFVRMLSLAPAKTLQIDRPHNYLRRIATNLLRDWARARACRSAAFEKVRHETQDHVDQIAVLESRDTLRRLELAMSSLKPKTREIFLAHRLDGLSYAEIAERTGLSVSGVEKQMMKAIAKMDKFLDRP